jgi:hypothetical protein
MKSRIALSVLFVLMSLSTVAFGQSDAQKSFDQLKTLAGSWQGTFEGKPVQVTLRVTSMGNAILHEMTGGGPEDPITMFYMDNDRLTLTHYCDAGNRPRMVAKPSPDGKTVDFEFLDVAGSTQPGHMHHAVFTLIDANHHAEDWTYMQPGNKPAQGHLELVLTGQQ